MGQAGQTRCAADPPVGENNNWTFNLAGDENRDPNAPPSAWSFRLDNILFDQGRIAINDKMTKSEIEILVDPLGKPLPFSEVTGAKGKRATPTSRTTCLG